MCSNIEQTLAIVVTSNALTAKIGSLRRRTTITKTVRSNTSLNCTNAITVIVTLVIIR